MSKLTELESQLIELKRQKIELMKDQLAFIEGEIEGVEKEKWELTHQPEPSEPQTDFRRTLYHKERSKRLRVERHPRMVFAFTCACLLVAGFSQVFMRWYEQRATADNVATVQTYDNTPYFISQISGSAVTIAQQNDLYASVMIAQAVHESASGTSGLGSPPYYNLFGIKGQSASGWYVTMTTWEDDGYGNPYTIDDDFRVYGSWHESLEDYAKVLSWSYYDGVHRSNASTYQEATAFLTGRYATDTSYNLKLNQIIEKYNLTQYDDYQIITGNTLVWNEYREAYTSQEILDEDINWDNYTRGG